MYWMAGWSLSPLVLLGSFTSLELAWRVAICIVRL